MRKSELEQFRTMPDTLAQGSETGSGFFSKVYLGEIPDTVVKVSKPIQETDGNIDPWLIWAAYSMTEGANRPECPNIMAIRIDTETGGFHAIMEKLDETKNAPYRKTGIFPMDCDLEMGTFGDLIMDCLSNVGSNEVGDTPVTIDCHRFNWMERKGEPVLIDPFAFLEAECTEAAWDYVRECAERSGGRIILI